MELSRTTHMSNQHTLDFQRSKSEHKGKPDTKSAGLQQQQQHSCAPLWVFFSCQKLWVFRGCQERQAGRSAPKGVWEEAPAAPPALVTPRCARGTQPHEGKLVKIWPRSKEVTCLYFPGQPLQTAAGKSRCFVYRGKCCALPEATAARAGCQRLDPFCCPTSFLRCKEVCLL